MIAFPVFGDPGPKGSPRVYTKTPRGVPLRRPRVRADSDKTEAWATAVSWAAKLAMRGRQPFKKASLVLEVAFFLPRPAGHFGTRGNLLMSAPCVPAVKPDGDKLQRTTQDAMQGFVFDEDSRIIDWHGYKRYASKKTGAWISVYPWSPHGGDEFPKVIADGVIAGF